MKKFKLSKGFFKRTIILVVVFLLVGLGVFTLLSDLMEGANIIYKILVISALFIFLIGTIIYVEVMHQRKGE